MGCSTALALADSTEPGIEQEILRFLDGESDGGELFEALYGSVAREPIPERMLSFLRSYAPRTAYP